MSDKTDLKNTINLPKTDFSMKANLPQKEPKIIEKWQSLDLYKRLREKYKKSPKYILHDGPPYSNGDIHMGHALNKILKDIVIKYYTMKGFNAPFVPGWDNHGLPVEHQLFKDLKITKYDISQVEFRKKAANFALKYVEIQKKQFKRLGIFGDWDKPYLTLDKNYEAEIVRAFGKLVKKNYIYKDRIPVNWCYRCETALAEAEVEYDDHISNSVYVKFKAEEFHRASDILQKSDKDKIFFIIWTTTPWTLVANVAVSLNGSLNYAIVEAGDELWILLESLVEPLFKKIGRSYKLLGTNLGSFFEGSLIRHPFIDRKSPVVLANYVSSEEGTGCVHTAPGHGMEDYITGKKYGLSIIMPVDEKGKFDKTAAEFSGINVHDADIKIIEKLKQNGTLIFDEKIAHSYPHCWRCKSPIIFRATEQWFLGVDRNNLRNTMLSKINKDINWIPKAGRERISAMVELRPDWCLSRQRLWGVPIPIFYCKKCCEPLMDAALIEKIADLMEKEGADVWFIKDESALLPKDTSCKKCNSRDFVKEKDILDVWFDSGISHQAVLKNRPDLKFPAELYLEGSDQHRGWFQSSLITGVAIEGDSPFKNVLTHGFVVDGTGKKMSKSLGNVISPIDTMRDYGADILRLWVSSSDYSEDIRISPEILNRVSDSYRKIRNTFKFLLGNISDFDPASCAIAKKDMLEVDLWALRELGILLTEVEEAYTNFQFHKVYSLVYNFSVVKLSNIYLDILKDRLYTFKNTSAERRSAQTALYEILLSLCKIISPILSFTGDEVFESLTKDKFGSIHLETWPDIENFNREIKSHLDDRKYEDWNKLFLVREVVLKALEIKRGDGLIGSSLESKIIINCGDTGINEVLNSYSGFLPAIFIASQVELAMPRDVTLKADDLKLTIGIEKAEGKKCERCWNYDVSTGLDKDHPNICPKCVKAVRN